VAKTLTLPLSEVAVAVVDALPPVPPASKPPFPPEAEVVANAKLLPDIVGLLPCALAVAVVVALPPCSPSPPAAPAPSPAAPFSATEVNVAVTLAACEYAAAMPRAKTKGMAVRHFHLNAIMGNGSASCLGKLANGKT
jgi:hypothetical protein